MKKSTISNLFDVLIRKIISCFLTKSTASKLGFSKFEDRIPIDFHENSEKKFRIPLRFFAMTLFCLAGITSWSQTINLTVGSNAQTNANEWATVLTTASITKKALVHDNNNTNDDQFTTGSKDASILPLGWEWTYGQTNNKGDISNAGAVILGDYLYFFGDRASINGDAQIGFWFFLNPVAPAEDDKGAEPFTGTHAVGDILILSNFTNGGGTSGIRIYKWVGVGSPVATDGPFQLLSGSTDDKAYVNTELVTVPTNVTLDGQTWAYKNPPVAQYPIGAFFLGRIHLKAEGREEIEGCFSSFLLETRNSQSIDASLQDFASHSFGGEPVALGLTGSSICSNDGNVGTITSSTSAIGINYQLYQGLNPNPVTVQGVKAGTGSGLTWTGLASGTGYYVVGSENGDVTCNSTSDSVNVSITPNPAPSVADQPACVGGTATFSTANLGAGFSYQWKLGNTNVGSNSNSYTTPTLAIGDNGNVYTVVVTKTGTTCTGSDPGTLTVNPNPTANAGTAPTAECPETDGNDFNLSGSFANGTALWTVKANSATGTAVGSVSSGGTTATPIVHVNGVGSVTFTLTVTSNKTPSCGTATSEVTVTVNPGAVTPSLKIINPSLCGTNPNTGSIQVCSPVVGTTYKLYLNNVFSTEITAVTNTDVIFTGLGAGINPRIDVLTGTGCTASANCTNNIIGNCPDPRPTSGDKIDAAPKEVIINNAGFDAYPVPFKDQLNIKYKFDYKTDVKIEIFDLRGVLILSKTDSDSYYDKEIMLDFNFNVNKEQIYLVKVTTNRGSSVKKVISSN